MHFADVREWVASHTADTLTLVGLVLALIGIGVALAQLHRSNRIAQIQTWLTLRDLLTNYDEVHANLRRRGKWWASHDEPNTVEDWAKVETYMGLFEYFKVLFDNNMLSKDDVIRGYRYRIGNILANPRIVTYKLHEQADGWRNFIAVCRVLRLPIPPPTRGLAPFIRER